MFTPSISGFISVTVSNLVRLPLLLPVKFRIGQGFRHLTARNRASSSTHPIVRDGFEAFHHTLERGTSRTGNGWPKRQSYTEPTHSKVRSSSF